MKILNSGVTVKMAIGLDQPARVRTSSDAPIEFSVLTVTLYEGGGYWTASGHFVKKNGSVGRAPANIYYAVLRDLPAPASDIITDHLETLQIPGLVIR